MNEIFLKRIQNEDISPKKIVENNKAALIKIEPPVILGRGPLLKCASKKVSRTHAEVSWDDDRILITSTHTSPTFVTVAGKDKILSNGQSAVLNCDDDIKLLKDDFFYKVIIKLKDKTSSEIKNDAGIAEKIQEAISDDKNNSDNHQPASPVKTEQHENVPLESVASSQNEKLVEDTNNKKAYVDNAENSADTKSVIVESQEHHERKLPQWMVNCSSRKTQNESKDTKTPKAKLHGRAQTSAKMGAKKLLQVSDDEDATKNSKKHKNTSESGNVAKRKKEAGKETKKYHTVSQDPNLSEEEEMSGRDLHSISDEENDSEQLETSGDKDGTEESKCNTGVTGDKNKTEESNDNTRINSQHAPRLACVFGGNCYRRNPNHRTSFAHPGDSDYASPDESDDEKPECEFGVNCYRKNPQHKKAYKHTRKPQQQRAAKKKAKYRQKEADDDSENEYDLNDSFLNDDSTDDYQPTDSSDDSEAIDDGVEEEDTKRMLKEAKRFKRSK